MNRGRVSGVGVVLVALLVQGCATHIKPPETQPSAAKVKFSTFKTVAMTPVGLADTYAKSGANQKARKKIDELLTTDMKKLFPAIRVVDEASKLSKAGTLLIVPHIKEIKFIGGAARFWMGAFAGSSAVLLQVTYTNLETGDVVANPVFYRKASAFAGGMYGAADNKMLGEVVQDAVNYTSFNR